MTDFRLFDSVELSQPTALDNGGIAPAGTPGAIVEVLEDGAAYLVELFGAWTRRDEAGNNRPASVDTPDAFRSTLDVVTVSGDEISLIAPAAQTVGTTVELLSIVDELPQESVVEIVDFARGLQQKSRKKPVLAVAEAAQAYSTETKGQP